MTNNLKALPPIRRTGSEHFYHNGQQLPENLLSFWQWSSSDIVGNALRGQLAEFIVASDLGIADGVRQEWDAYDLVTKDGIRVEVKSAAYLQSWEQTKYSSISFGIQPTVAWETDGTRSTEVKRQADVYVFCLLDHKDKATVDPLDMDQWKFYVLPTRVLDEKVGDQKSIVLSSLLSLEPVEVRFGEIGKVIDEIF